MFEAIQDTNLDHFMKEFYELTYPNPMERGARIVDDNVSVTLVPWQNRAHLSDINTFGNRGEGRGTKALNLLKSLADKHGVEIEGIAATYSKRDTGPQNNQELRAWYKKNGFQVGADSKVLYTPASNQAVKLRGFDREH